MDNLKRNVCPLTVVVCSYNSEQYVAKCFDSLLAQQVPKDSYTILFMDDGSIDRSLSVVKRYAEREMNIRVVERGKQRGLIQTCNEALTHISTPYFMRVDADDYIMPQALELVFRYLYRKEDFIVFGRYDIDCLSKQKQRLEVDRNNIYSWVAAGTVFKTDVVKRVGGYSNEFWEEYDLYLKLLESGAQYAVVAEPIYCYMRRSDSLTKDMEKKKQGFEDLERKWGLPVLHKYGNYESISSYYR